MCASAKYMCRLCIIDCGLICCQAHVYLDKHTHNTHVHMSPWFNFDPDGVNSKCWILFLSKIWIHSLPHCCSVVRCQCLYCITFPVPITVPGMCRYSIHVEWIKRQMDGFQMDVQAGRKSKKGRNATEVLPSASFPDLNFEHFRGKAMCLWSFGFNSIIFFSDNFSLFCLKLSCYPFHHFL